MSGGKESRYTGTWNNHDRFTSNGSVSFPLRSGKSYEVKSLVAPTKVETMAFNEIETVLEKYLQPKKRLVIAEQTKFVAITQRKGESSGVFLARLKEAARYCEFGNLKTIAEPEANMIRLLYF